MEITLHNGDQIVLRDPSIILERDRRKLKAAFFGMRNSTYSKMRDKALEEAAEAGDDEVARPPITPEDLEILNQLNDVGILVLIEKWTRPDGTSVVPDDENLGVLDMWSYGELQHAAAPLIEDIDLDWSPTPPGVESPTGPSND